MHAAEKAGRLYLRLHLHTELRVYLSILYSTQDEYGRGTRDTFSIAGLSGVQIS